MPFSNNYQIKLIGTGLESGTWGTSTNNNLERIEQSLGQSVAINVEAPPTGSTVATGPPYVLTWITSDTANVNVSGSEGRAKYVEFVSGGSLAENVTVEVRGNTAGILPNRFYLVRNSINTSSTAATLTLNAGAGSNYTIESGACALVVINGTSVVGGLTAGTALNAISNLQVDNLQFSASASDIKLPDNVASALEIKSTSANSEFLRFDTASNHLEVAPGSGVNTVEIQADTVDASSQNTSVSIRDGQADSFEILEGTNSYLKFDTSSQTVHIGEESSDVETLDISTDTIRVANQATDIRINAGSTTALTVSDSTGTILTVDTLSEPEKIITASTSELEVLGTLDVDGTSDFSSTATFSSVDINGGTIDGAAIASSTIDSTPIGSTSANVGKFSSLESTGTTNGLHLSTSDAYANFGATAGSSGYGIRDDSGKLEIKKSGGSWNDLGPIFVSTAIAAASVGGDFKQGAIDIGPFRIIWDTITLGSNASTTVTPGVHSEVYVALACGAGASGVAFASGSAAVASATTVTVSNNRGDSRNVTWFVIGDSGY